jgi:hypothetical protein
MNEDKTPCQAEQVERLLRCGSSRCVRQDPRLRVLSGIAFLRGLCQQTSDQNGFLRGVQSHAILKIPQYAVTRLGTLTIPRLSLL